MVRSSRVISPQELSTRDSRDNSRTVGGPKSVVTSSNDVACLRAATSNANMRYRAPMAGPMNHDEWSTTQPASAPMRKTRNAGTHAVTPSVVADWSAGANMESTDTPVRGTQSAISVTPPFVT